jgi:hypothetical protein
MITLNKANIMTDTNRKAHVKSLLHDRHCTIAAPVALFFYKTPIKAQLGRPLGFE